MAILAPAYDGSFGSIGFMQLVPLTSPPVLEGGTNYHITSTNSNARINTGLLFREWSIKVAVDATERASLESAVPSNATLTLPSGTWSNARLKAIDPPIKAPGFPTYEVTLHLQVGN